MSELGINFPNIQGCWSSKGENEVDIVAIHEFEKCLVFCEVKHNPCNISFKELEKKTKDIFSKYPKFSTEFI